MPARYPTSININSGLWKRAKIEAVSRGITVTQLLEQALEAELNRSNNRTFRDVANETLKPPATSSEEMRISPPSGDTMNMLKIGPAYEGSMKQFKNRIESAVSGTTFRTPLVVADIYNSKDRKTLRPKYLKALSDLSHRYNMECVNEVDVLKNTGLGGYLEGIIPYVVADLVEEDLIRRCERRGEIGLTEKGRLEVNQED